ncbi:3-phenylpropionate/cinnamic acid dioxygenase ferredoxin--NAD(+) reductase subunit [Acinetobacter faecalis]|uniref:3-phenylpropionate/cinnamic acid dioxygenase ferredoxin--NAD(+) reductase subunit n=1 Tax=Acinetobacter faecalis TaxID=2665161 RepID=A0A6L6GC20_9GAMM|nr:3-phenylpropionate/cinnamic acid dioxygenase ferredoxin--NAD(+) reductase subunit [Acinetobacter faecalis]MDY6461902.1 3-phenylpropionate/cinnamic acid dioxygenase ferredoxin--NAD(+) reductase subunit [Acinetobacter faecalis]MDY6530509.1 3-phenylpropionate/cinnamic acid dioxygenase ferredoxin--NAD(+) reductase subunit [Acinetobacter faecalis]MDY6536690.1 3-phenylpropionate/cinnamic acid dioxygenase ferredoxin--NAD(+) reductase subunit [Acinetobacter faecalis]MDY6550605.1 3-phenylpropionate/c
MSNIETVVIVGAGQAGASAILELRANKYEGKIILVGDETHLPYERPPLSKDVILNPAETKIEILSEQKLADLGVEVIRGNGVVKINSEAKIIDLQNGDSVAFDKLLLATGGAARRLPNFDALGKHVYTLRNLEDSQALVPVLQAGRRIVLIGGGVIGLELASSARYKECNVTVIEQGPMVMGRSSPRVLSEFLLAQQRLAGVDVRLETKVADCKLDGEEVVITLEGGEELRADAVVYGIGIVPNAQLAVEAGLDVDFAIKINENCQTSNADIYAAGDVATQLRADGEFRRVETWENANIQAGVFARHVMNVEHPVENPAWFWTDQLNINYQFVGDMAAAEWLVRGEINPELRQESSFVLFGVTDGVIVGGITVNAAKEMRHLKKLISKQAAFEADKYLDISQDLRKLVK